MVLAPEHPLVDKITTHQYRPEVQAYREAAELMDEIARETLDREKTGVFTGAYVINPVNQERIPILKADFTATTFRFVSAKPGEAPDKKGKKS